MTHCESSVVVKKKKTNHQEHGASEEGSDKFLAFFKNKIIWANYTMNRGSEESISNVYNYSSSPTLPFGLTHSVQLFMISHLNKETFPSAHVSGKERGKNPPHPRKISMTKIKGVSLKQKFSIKLYPQSHIANFNLLHFSFVEKRKGNKRTLFSFIQRPLFKS